MCMVPLCTDNLVVFQAYKVMSTEMEGGGQSQLFKDYYAHNTNGRQAGSLRFGSIYSFVIWEIFSLVVRDLHIEFFTFSVSRLPNMTKLNVFPSFSLCGQPPLKGLGHNKEIKYLDKNG